LVLSELLHEISVAFGCSSNLRTLLIRLGDGMARHLPIVEIELARLIEHLDEVRISAYAPASGRRWDGKRSVRFLERQGVIAPTFVTDEPARVGIAPDVIKLKLPIGRSGLLSIAVETDISVLLGSKERREVLVDVLTLHCVRLGQLSATASRCRAADHRRIGAQRSEQSTDDSVDTGDTDLTVSGARRSVAAISDTSVDGAADPERSEQGGTTTVKPACELQSTEMSLPAHRHSITEMPVETIDAALIRCIAAALEHSKGKIYGPGGAGELLGLKPSTLQSKMRKLGIERAAFTG
jgi:hypothetical protein